MMSQLQKNSVFLFFIFLFATVQAKSNSTFWGANKFEKKTASGLSILNSITGDTIKPFANSIDNDTVNKITVNEVDFTLLAPDATLIGTGSGTVYNGNPVFRNCSNPVSADFSFRNGSTTTATNVSYKIVWGDGSPDFVVAAPWNVIQNHTYLRGTYNLVFTVVNNLGESTSKNYTVFIGTNPEVSISNPGGNAICTNNQLSFRILGIANNSPSTVYKVTINDATPPSVQFYNQPALGVDFIDVTHTFVNTSCGTNSQVGNATYTDAFYASVEASNPCNVATGLIAPLYVSTPPIPNFAISTVVIPPSIVPINCTNTTIQFTNNSIGGSLASAQGCNTNSRFVWAVSPATYTISGGTLGNDYGTSDTDLWDSGSNSLDLNFTAPGTYTITLKIGNACGTNQISKTICIESPLVPSFTLNTNSVCTTAPGNGDIIVNNTTDESKSCIPPTYSWSVTYASSYCGISSNWNFTGGTNGSSKNPSFHFTNPGTYVLKLDAKNSCGTISTSQVIEVKQPPIVSINSINPMCSGYTIANPLNPTAVVNSCAPASSVLTYAWSFPGGTPATSTLANPIGITYPASTTVPIIYTVSLSVTNECGTTVAADQTFTIQPIPHVANTPPLEQTICSGTASVKVDLIPDYVRTANTFSWVAAATSGITGFIPASPGIAGDSSTPVFEIPSQTISTTASSSGTVTYTITPWSFGCSGPTVDYVIKVDPLPYFTTQPTDSGLCQGGITVPLQVVVNVTPTTYQWYSNTVGNNTTGTTISGANSAIYTPPNTLGINYYYCTVTFAVGACTSITSRAAKVEVVILPTIDVHPTPTQNVCVGGQILTPLTVHYVNGAGIPTYQWYSNTTNSNVGGSLLIGETNVSFTPPPAALGTVYYYVKILIPGSNCGTLTSNPAEIKAVPDPTVTTPLLTQSLCVGTTPTTLSVTASGGLDNSGGLSGTYSFNYQWYSSPNNTPNAGIQINGATSNTYIPPTTLDGTMYYFCYVTQSKGLGCDAYSNKAEVIVYPQPTITLNPINEYICAGGFFAPLNVAYAGSFGSPQYQWFSNAIPSNAGGTAIGGATFSIYTPTDVTTAIKYYYCEISFLSGGCVTISSNFATLKVNQQTIITTQPTASQTLCVGGTTTLTVVPGNGAGTPTYQWYYNGSTNSNTGGVAVGTNSDSYTPPPFATAGTNYYYVTIQYSGNGCTIISSAVARIDVVDDPTITTQPIPSQKICAGALPLKVVATGGTGSFSYQWYSNSTNSNTGGTPIAGATSDTFTPPNESPAEFSSITKYFYCEITQSGFGCGVTSNISEVIFYPQPKIDAQPQSSTICLGQTTPILSVTSHDGILVMGSPSYQWHSNTINSYVGSTLIVGATTDKYAPPVGVVGTNYYYCVISFLGGCNSGTSNIATITVNPVPVIANKTTTTCNGVAFTVTPVAGGAEIVPAGTVYTWSSPVISPAGTITGGSTQATPQPNISQALTNTSENISTATYTVTPVSGASCSGVPFTVTVTVNPSMYAHEVITNSTCFKAHNGSIVTNIVGGIPFGGATPYIVSWTGPAGFSSASPTISSLEPGIYHLNIKDNSGCAAFDKDYTVTEPADILISTITEKDITCFGYGDGAIDISITGGTASYIYVWTKDGSAFKITEDISSLTPGVYTVAVTDANGCTPVNNPKTVSFAITQPPVLAVSLVSQLNVKCYGDATGEIVVSTIGGTPFPVTNYAYAWTGPNGFISTNQNLTGLYAGTYSLVVTDQSGCQTPLQVIITQNDEIIITPTVTTITCAGNNNGSISIVVTGGIPPYQITWSDFGTGDYRDDLAPGDYLVTVTDKENCIKTQNINVPVPPPFSINPVVSNISCFGTKDGSITLNINGGVPPVKVLWDDNPSAGSTRNNLAAGIYSVTISDGTPCYIIDSFTIIEPQPLALTANLINAFDCDNANSGAINLLVAGGTPPFTYAWSNGATTEDLVNIPAGNYLVTVTDARGCKKQAQYIIYRQPPIVVAVDTKTDFNCDTHFVKQTFVANVTGGLPPYQLSWSSGVVSGANNEIMNTSQNGAVTLSVVDGLGCPALYTFTVDIPELGYPSFSASSYAFTTYGLYSVVDPIQFTNTANGYFVSVAWNFGDGSVSNEINPTHAYLLAGQYTVLQAVTYPFGCVYTYALTLNVEKGYELISPTAFTPSGDGINDSFIPQFIGMKSIQFEVYNTWGELIYSEKGETVKGWDGYVKNKLSENGNYFYRIKAITFYGAEVLTDGPFTLLN